MLDFSAALSALKEGMKVTRNEWQPYGQYVVLQPERTEPVEPHFDRPAPNGITEGRVRRFEPYLLLHARGSAVPWQPTVSDVLAEDWLCATSDGDITWPDGTVA